MPALTSTKTLRRASSRMAAGLCLCAALPVTALPVTALADEKGPIGQTLHDYNLTLAVGASFQPTYEGSSHMEVSPIPYFSAEFFDRLTVDITGLDLKAYENGPFRLDLKAGYETGRSEDDDDALDGMGDIDFGFTAGGKMSFDLGPADLFVSATKTMGGSDGLTGVVGIETRRKVSDRLSLDASLGVTLADSNYMESYFGVDAGQAARSGYAEYKPSAGLKSVDASIGVTWSVNESVFLKAQQSLGLLVGDAADSPLVEEKLQPQTMVMLGYRF
jgi:outer membrane scaffolding protein for murein synthesis (MipA/OmpV family)